MKTLKELNAIKERVLQQNMSRKPAGGKDIRIIVGMATCGIAAGARAVVSALISELEKRNISNVVVSQTGCVGMCAYEPIIEVLTPDCEPVTYIQMNREKAVRVINDHIVNGNIVKEFTVDSIKK